MKNIYFETLLFSMLILSLMVIPSCTNNPTDPGGGNDGGTITPFEPDEGEGWPTEALLNVFNLKEWERPEGLEDVYFIAWSENMFTCDFIYSICQHIANIDILEISFESATDKATLEIDSFLSNISMWTSSSSGHIGSGNGFEAPGNNVFYRFYHAQYRFIRFERIYNSEMLSFRWPSRTELEVFGLGNLAMPSGLRNFVQLNNCWIDRYHDYERFNIMFSGATQQTKTTLFNFFDSIALLDGQESYSGGEFSYFSRIVNNRVFWYWFGIYQNGMGFLYADTFETDLLPGEGTGWPLETQLTVFNLGDWSEPSGLSDVSWSAYAEPGRIRLSINFTSATENTANEIKNYFGFSDWWGHYSIRLWNRDENYDYDFDIRFTLSRGGSIILEGWFHGGDHINRSSINKRAIRTFPVTNDMIKN